MERPHSPGNFEVIEAFRELLCLLPNTPLGLNSSIRDLVNPYNLMRTFIIISGHEEDMAYFQEKHSIEVEDQNLIVPIGLIHQIRLVENAIAMHIKKTCALDHYQMSSTELNLFKVVISSDLYEIKKLCRALFAIAMVGDSRPDCEKIMMYMGQEKSQTLIDCLEKDRIYVYPGPTSRSELDKLQLFERKQEKVEKRNSQLSPVKWDNLARKHLIDKGMYKSTDLSCKHPEHSTISSVCPSPDTCTAHLIVRRMQNLST